MKNVSLAAAIALGSASGALIGYSALAGGDKVAFPENFDKGTLYATVDRFTTTSSIASSMRRRQRSMRYARGSRSLAARC
jgi:hypothetical protein